MSTDHTPAPATQDPQATVIRSAPPKAALRGVTGAYFGKVIPLTSRLTIGRGSDCDLVIDEAEMSRHHAVIETTAAGIRLRDLGSANGTFVNGAWVHNAELKIGDQIGFDRNRFLIESLGDANLRARDAAAQPARPAASHASAKGGSSAALWVVIALVVAAAAAAGWYFTRG